MRKLPLLLLATLSCFPAWCQNTLAKLELASPLARNTVCTEGTGVVGVGKDGAVYEWGIPSGKLAHRSDFSKQTITALACSAKYIAVGFRDGSVALVDRASGTTSKQIQTGKNEINFVQVAPDSSFLVVAPGLTAAQVWDIQTGKQKATLANDFAASGAIAISPDSKVISSGDEDTVVRIYDRNGKLIASNKDGDLETLSMAFLSSRQLAVAGADGVVRLLDVATGRLLRSTKGDGDIVMDLVASGDGRSVCAVYLDNYKLSPTKIQLWDMETASLKKSIEPKGLIGGGTGQNGLLLIRSDDEKSATVLRID